MTSEEVKNRLNNWALEFVTGISRRTDDPVGPMDEQMLASGVYHDALGREIRFRLPWDVATGKPISVATVTVTSRA